MEESHEKTEQINHLFKQKFLGVEEFRFVFENISTPIIIMDAEGGIMSINNAGLKLLNYQEEQELQHAKFYELIHSNEDRQKICLAFNALKDGKKKRYNFESQYKTKDGRVKWCKTNTSAIIGKNDHFLGAICIGQDITDAKIQETELKKSIGELDEILKQISTLTGLLPICASCKRIKNVEENRWEEIEQYIQDRSQAEFSHGLCPDCAKKLYPEHYKDKTS